MPCAVAATKGVDGGPAAAMTIGLREHLPAHEDEAWRPCDRHDERVEGKHLPVHEDEAMGDLPPPWQSGHGAAGARSYDAMRGPSIDMTIEPWAKLGELLTMEPRAPLPPL